VCVYVYRVIVGDVILMSFVSFTGFEWLYLSIYMYTYTFMYMYNYTYVERENGADLGQFSSYASQRSLSVFYVSSTYLYMYIYTHTERESFAGLLHISANACVLYVYLMLDPPFQHSRICVMHRNTSSKFLQKSAVFLQKIHIP